MAVSGHCRYRVRGTCPQYKQRTLTTSRAPSKSKYLVVHSRALVWEVHTHFPNFLGARAAASHPGTHAACKNSGN